MRAFSGSTIAEQPPASNRRQPVRHTRTNPARTASNVASAQGRASAQTPDNERNANLHFCPALTHYTDAITALPKEMIRHNTMLKEVDAKIFGPEAQLGELVNTVLKTPNTSQMESCPSQGTGSTAFDPTLASNGKPTTSEKKSRSGPSSHSSTEDPSDPSHFRRLQFQKLRSTLFGMLKTLDEKNHVINTALDCLEKQQKRCNSSFPHIEDEISEEARLGSLTHWAYTDKGAEKKGIIAGERTRRAANTAAAIQEAEAAALRSESRREALAAKRPRNQHLDSDFDDGRTVGKKLQAGGKGRKAADAASGNTVGLGIANGGPLPNKRRKIEKPIPGNSGAEKAMASVYGSNSGSGVRGGGSVKDPSLNDATGKKRGRGGAAINGTGRRRAGTNASAVNSPLLASSPVVGTFATAKDRQGRSPAPAPAPAVMQRMPSSRARQSSTQNVLQASRDRSSSTNHKSANGNGMYAPTADVEKVSGVTGRTASDVKSSMKETVNAKGEHLIEAIGSGDGAGDLRGGLVVGSKNQERSLKREESTNGRTRPPSISVSTRGNGSKQPSKTGTPINASFAESVRTRAPREIPLKRSHKKGAGLAAQIAAAAATHGDDVSSVQGDEDDDEGGDEPRYCYCNGVSYGEMVGCDGKECQKEWFHLECVGLEKAPGRNVKWYCDECKENLKDKKFNGSAR